MAASCKKDELTVVSTATGHSCGTRTILIDVDSLLQLSDGGWDPVPEQHFTFCECDTVRLVPTNILGDWYFARWYFGSMPNEVDFDQAVLDTITSPTHVTMDVHNDDAGPDPQHVHIRIDLHAEVCE
jgi:hypothetical protein